MSPLRGTPPCGNPKQGSGAKKLDSRFRGNDKYCFGNMTVSGFTMSRLAFQSGHIYEIQDQNILSMFLSFGRHTVRGLFLIFLNILHVQNKNASSMGADDQLIVARMDRHIMYWCGG